ncbi:MAG: diguanylate cyclase [Rhodoferax sp.]|nr:diguanylate cyclase [Rhodoferax sp.]MCF8210523.1 diguanylate cyclase [Rhodoferax sp.]
MGRLICFHPTNIALCLLATLWCVMAGSVRAAEPAIAFTPREKAYIEQLGSTPIKMCVDPDWVPFERINQDGKHEGIAADLVQLVAQRVGLAIALYPAKDWDESLAASKGKRCQIMSFLNQTPAREAWLIFTDTIFFDPNVIITREEHDYVADASGLKGARVALPRGTMVEERVRKDFPNLEVVLTASEPESMVMVSERKADLTIRSLIVAANAIKKEGLFNLKIAGQIPQYTNQLRIGVLKGEPVLRDILDKGVKTISAQEREAIANKHVSINVTQGIDYRLVWKIVGAAALVIVLGLLWNRKLSALNRELERVSVTDKLTGLFNRMKIDEALESEIQRSLRFRQVFSIILIDVDHFKQVNDTHGHQVGDQVLVQVAQLLKTNTRETDVVGRWGGEEFMVISTHTEQAGARKLAEHLRQILQDHTFPVVQQKTASFGVTTYQTGDKPHDMVVRADTALYAAKKAGRNRVEVG